MATTTPNYGWDVPTSTDYVAQGAVAIETLGDDIDATLWTALGGAYPGLRLIKKQTIGSAVASVTVTGAFSATYDNYCIMVSGGACSADNNDFQLRLGSTTTNYYGAFVLATYATGAVSAAVNNNTASYVAYMGSCNTSNQTAKIEINSPFLTKNTTFSAYVARDSLGGHTAAILKDSTSYTAFTLYPSGGTLTGGTIYVYGYGAS